MSSEDYDHFEKIAILTAVSCRLTSLELQAEAMKVSNKSLGENRRYHQDVFFKLSREADELANHCQALLGDKDEVHNQAH